MTGWDKVRDVYLKSLTLKGFKSFASATTMKFEPGICAVVGPNGSGKSNVVDALAWVMGEQGAKQLRGGKMEDVIFAGAGGRKPLGRAEVTLTINNDDGALPIEYSEVSITRRMFRDGASEYEINGSKARLMDIQELLSDSGIGREMHVIVGQGKITEILESRPEDRRAYIEEAAGVLKHKRRKEKAQRKLTGMQANLDRLTDLTEELKRQLKPLARQAEAAKRAQTVQAEVRESRSLIAGYELTRLFTAKMEHEEAQTAANVELTAATAGVQEAEQQHQDADEILVAAQPVAAEANRIWFELSALKEKVDATVRIASDRASHVEDSRYQGPDPEVTLAQAEDAEAQVEALEERAEVTEERLETILDQVEDAKEKAREADDEHMRRVRAIADRREGIVRLVSADEQARAAVERAEARVQEAAAECDASRERARKVDAEAREARRKAEEHEQQRGPLEEARVRAVAESQAAESRLKQLRDEERAGEQQVASLTSRIETLEATRVDTLPDTSLQPLATTLRVDRGMEKAVAAALGRFTEAVIGAPAKHTGDGWPRTVVVDDSAGDAWHVEVSALPSGTSWLTDHIVAPRAVRRILADTVLVGSVEQAFDVVAQDPRLRAVTPDGTLVGEGWAEVGEGTRSPVEVSSLIDDATAALATARATVEEMAGTVAGAEDAAEQARVEAASATAAMREFQAEQSALEREALSATTRAANQRTQHKANADKLSAAEQQLRIAKEDAAEAADRLARLEDTDEGEDVSTEDKDRAAERLAQVQAMEMEAKIAARSARDDVERATQRAQGLRRKAAADAENKKRFEEQQEKRRRAVEKAIAVRDAAATVAARVEDALTRAHDEREATRQEVARAEATVKEKSVAVHDARQRLSRAQTAYHEVEMKAAQSAVRLEEAERRATGETGVPATTLREQFHEPEGFSITEERKKLKSAEKALASLGKVNPLALEEYAALEERYSFLTTQLDDVIRARKDLHQVIEEVDDKILTLFTDAWHDVEREFPEVFATLFPGGEGKLLLTDPTDMLTTGIEVEARPPGKKVKRLSLLSGGEKTLTALAMLVAIFKARPSPFYVMDEVEAALDDVNLRRLIALFEKLRATSQLIVITHQKPTMDVANVLYGVTMQGDGITRVISQRLHPVEQ